MNLIILTDNDLTGENKYLLKDNRAEHILKILKLSSGDEIEIGILNGPAGIGKILSADNNQIIIEPQHLKQLPDTIPKIILICALPRPQTVKKVLITSAMIGIREVHFIRANRVEKSYYHSPLLESDNIIPYLIEGLSQGKRTDIPSVKIHNRFKPFFEDYFPTISNKNMIKLLPDIETNSFLNKIYQGKNNPIALAIGPEGGWVPFETDFMKEAGFKSFKLSQSILRVEHALTAALAQIELIGHKL